MQTDTENPEDGADEAEATLGTQSEIDELEGCRRRLKATVPGEKVREELDRNYRDLAQTVHIRGFRKGKVPRPLLESRYGEDVEKEVRESIVETSFSQVFEET